MRAQREITVRRSGMKPQSGTWFLLIEVDQKKKKSINSDLDQADDDFPVIVLGLYAKIAFLLVLLSIYSIWHRHTLDCCITFFPWLVLSGSLLDCCSQLYLSNPSLRRPGALLPHLLPSLWFPSWLLSQPVCVACLSSSCAPHTRLSPFPGCHPDPKLQLLKY